MFQKGKRFSSLKSGVSSFIHYTAYIKDLKKIERLGERKRLQEIKLVFLEDSLIVLEFYRRTRKLEKRIEKLEDKIDIQKKATKLCVARCGPVCNNLETVLKAHKIPIQAYHGRSFTGNHSQKYIMPSTNRVICSSILSQTI